MCCQVALGVEVNVVPEPPGSSASVGADMGCFIRPFKRQAGCLRDLPKQGVVGLDLGRVGADDEEIVGVSDQRRSAAASPQSVQEVITEKIQQERGERTSRGDASSPPAAG